MEKDIDKIAKNSDTDIVVRVDDFGGKVGVTIREFVRSERYTGFTKAGTRIPADKFKQFKSAINAIDEKELEVAVVEAAAKAPASSSEVSSGMAAGKSSGKAGKKEISEYEETEM